MSPSFSGCQESGVQVISAAASTADPLGASARGTPALPVAGRPWSCGHHAGGAPEALNGCGVCGVLPGLSRGGVGLPCSDHSRPACSVRGGFQSPWYLSSGVSATGQGPRDPRGRLSPSLPRREAEVSQGGLGDQGQPPAPHPGLGDSWCSGQCLNGGFEHSGCSYSEQVLQPLPGRRGPRWVAGPRRAQSLQGNRSTYGLARRLTCGALPCLPHARLTSSSSPPCSSRPTPASPPPSRRPAGPSTPRWAAPGPPCSWAPSPHR